MGKMAGSEIMKRIIAGTMLVIFFIIVQFHFMRCCREARETRVMSTDQKKIHFQRLSKKVYIGKDGKRPFILATSTHVWNGQTWVKY